MQTAFLCAQKAYNEGEIPVGAILVNSTTGNIIAKSANATIALSNPLAHAEMMVINEAVKLGINRLNGYSLYTTMEPCQMCAGAIALAKLGKLYVGCEDKRFGAVLNNAKIFSSKSINYKPEVYSGIMEEECANLLRNFFKGKR